MKPSDRLSEEELDQRGAQVLSEAGTPPPPEESVLYAENLIAGYLPGINILNGAHIHVREGELVGIIGPNGAGKSTLIKAMFGLVEIRDGFVKLRDEDITGLTAHELVEHGVGYVPQTKNVFPSLTIEENLEMGVYLKPSLFEERFDFVADLFPKLKDRRKQRAGSLSGGERQMVAMGSALMLNPQLLLLDEPSAGLSPKLVSMIFERIVRVNETGVAIIMVEQNAKESLRMAHRGYVLANGENRFEGTGQSLLNDPEVGRLYLGG